MKDFKEVWQEYFEDGLQLGMSEDEACAYADRFAADYFASLADYFRDIEQDRVMQ